MRSFIRRGKGILMFAIISATLLSAAASAQDMEEMDVAVYVTGDLPMNERIIFGNYLLTALINSGRCAGSKNADQLLTEIYGEHIKRDSAVTDSVVCEIGKRLGIKYVCVASVTPAFGFFMVSARIIHTGIKEVLFRGQAPSPLRTMDDITQVSNKVAENMFGIRISNAQTACQPAPSQTPGSAGGASAGASTAAVSVTGEARVAADRVAAAVKAFKDATAKSIDAANAVKTATQARNFSAIMDAKKKVESAAEAVKKAKADVTAAIELLNSAGPEATAAVKAMGIDLSMFAGKDGGGAGGENEDSRKLIRHAAFVDVAPFLVGIGESIADDEMGAFGIGLKYELNLSDYFGVAMRYEYYGNWVSNDQYYGGSRSSSISSWEWYARAYPTGSTFFIDAMLGYYTHTEYHYRYGGGYYGDLVYKYKKTYNYGKIGALFGWRVDMQNGLTWELAFGYRYAFGAYHGWDWPSSMFGGTGPRVVSAIGYGF